MEIDKEWYIAVVTHNTEKSSEKKLSTLFADEYSFTTYVPVQRELHEWASTGKRVWVDRVVCPCYLFIKCDEKTRYALACRASFIQRFMMDRARNAETGKHQFARIPSTQMDNFMRMVGDAETPVTIDASRLRIGSKVRVKSGSLAGLEGNLCREPDGSSTLAIRVNFLGYAKLDFPLALLELVEE